MRIALMLVAALVSGAARPMEAQSDSPIPAWGEVFAGGELERYLRVLQMAGVVRRHPWTLRPFSAPELDALAPPDTGHPWARRYHLKAGESGMRFAGVRPTLTVRANTTFPYGSNDGPVWAGRGLTTSAEAGFAARYGPLSLTVAPLAFRAENPSFTLMPNGQIGPLVYADGFYPGGIDLPQRFGDEPYTVLDPGQSTLRLDAAGAAIGLSTANEYWGPATEYPILLGNNAAGFPHVFLGTAAPLDLHVLRLHGRFVWGRLSQSEYSFETAAQGLRFGAALLLGFSSRYVPGLEIGVARFAHSGWRPGGPTLTDVLVLLGSQNRANLTAEIDDNQLATAFFRWVLPQAGFEVYGEYGRDDYNLDLRDFAQEPDHIGGYTVGFHKIVGSGAALRVLRAELQNLQFSVLAQGRGWAPFYTHGSTVRQGHTQQGQLLGSYAGFGGAGALVALDSYHSGGRWTVSWSRVLRYQRGAFASDSVIDPRGLDVQHALSWNALWFRGRYDVTAGVTAVYEFNRDFRADAFNLNATVGVRAAWR